MDNATLQRIKQRYGIVGNHEGLNRAIDIALKIAPVDLSVLIMGENGVGKEIFPRIIHDASLRRGKKYLAVNCGAIPDGTIDSELFGHEKGAFTGAVESREGYFATASGGTLFLDEVGELPLSTQARLLRVLETGEFIPVGSSTVKRTDVRIVAATNVDMGKAIREGKFREDLFYRLNAVSINIPPLRERGADAILLFKKFALEMSEKYKMPPIRLDAEAAQLLASYDWPGNVRQLKNLAENMSVTSEARDIHADTLRDYLSRGHTGTSIVPAGEKTEGSHRYDEEREAIFQLIFELRRDLNELKHIVTAHRLPAPAPTTHTGQTDAPAALTGTLSGRKHLFDGDETTIQEAEEIKENEEPAETEHTQRLDDLERRSIKETLAATAGNRRMAAARLGISERTLYRKIKEYGLDH